jgi:hypothetical protein
MHSYLHLFHRMKKAFVLLVVFLLAGLPKTEAQAIPLYENWGTIGFGDTPPQIDAFAFANYGIFNVAVGTLPYDFQNTHSFTNRGSMSSTVGFRFDTTSSMGQRVPARNFENQVSGTITVGPWLSVGADRIVNQGLLSAQASGMIDLRGGDINVSRSGLEIRPAQPSGFTFVGETNFLTDADISDWYWGGLTNADYDSATFFQDLPAGGFFVQSPGHIVTNAAGGIGFTSIGLIDPLSAVHTNQVSPTNYVVQAVFVGMPDDNYNANLRFGNPSGATGLRPIFVELAMADTNLVTEQVINHRLYFADRLASSTNYVMAVNLATGDTFRPAIYELGRTPPAGFGASGPGNTPIDGELFNNPEFEEGPVTNFWAAYGAIITSGASGAGASPLGSITNSSGRVEIEAAAVNLERARIRANGVLSVKTDHLISSDRALVDSPDLRYQLASTNGTLRIQNLANEFVVRQSGTIRAWSGLWTNISFDVDTIPPEDPEGEPTQVTNTIEHVFHALLLDATDMESLQPVTVHQLVANATNITVNDNMTVVDEFCVDGERVTLDSEILLTGTIRNWTCSNAPSVLFFTNSGSLTFPGIGNFGNDRTNPYTAFVNQGTLSGSTHLIHSDYVENSGTINASGRITLQVQTAKLEGGTHNSGADVIIRGQDVKFHQYNGLTGDRLVLDVTGSLSDSGGSANNVLSTGDGFHLLRKPAQGDLLGTALQTTAPRFARVDHVWAAADRGAVVEGFFNNVAIGQLSLSAGPSALLSFRGLDNTGSYAIYVDFLNLQGTVQAAFNEDDLESVLDLAPNLVIYYAYANVPVEQLDGRLNGQLRWIKEFAGPNSSVDVALRSGKTIRVNRGLRESLTIDSNGNGIANGLDPEPFDEPELDVEVVQTEPLVTQIRWFAAPHTTYHVEYATTFIDADWQSLETISNRTDSLQPVVVEDHTNEAQTQRYYRVRYQP